MRKNVKMKETMLELNEKENRAFYDTMANEEKALVNEWDDDTMRVPSKARMKELPSVSSILQKWEGTQPKIGKSNFINLDDIRACSLALSEKERRTCARILERGIKSIRKYLSDKNEPYTGMLKDMADEAELLETIIKRLA